MSIDCYCDYDSPAFWSQSFPKARKEHRCEECGRKIYPGERYEYVSGLWDGWFDQFKTCSHCCDIRKFVQSSIPCFCWAHGNLREDVKTAVDEAYYRARTEVSGLRFRIGRMEIARKRFESLPAPLNHPERERA